MSLVGQIKEKYNNYIYIYTDGSKVEEKVAAATVAFLVKYNDLRAINRPCAYKTLK